MTNTEIVILYDRNAEVGETLSALGETVHSWHPRFPNREEPVTLAYPMSGGVLMKHGGSFKAFKSMMKAYTKLENVMLGRVTSLHWRGEELVTELREACGQGDK